MKVHFGTSEYAGDIFFIGRGAEYKLDILWATSLLSVGSRVGLDR
jgi:hypothetical protein